MTLKILLSSILFLAALNPALAADNEPEEIKHVTLEERLDNVQEAITQTQSRYNYGQRQYERLQDAEELSDYLNVVTKVKNFN